MVRSMPLVGLYPPGIAWEPDHRAKAADKGGLRWMANQCSRTPSLDRLQHTYKAKAALFGQAFGCLPVSSTPENATPFTPRQRRQLIGGCLLTLQPFSGVQLTRLCKSQGFMLLNSQVLFPNFPFYKSIS
jgi:hypothetical protein